MGPDADVLLGSSGPVHPDDDGDRNGARREESDDNKTTPASSPTSGLVSALVRRINQIVGSELMLDAAVLFQQLSREFLVVHQEDSRAVFEDYLKHYYFGSGFQQLEVRIFKSNDDGQAYDWTLDSSNEDTLCSFPIAAQIGDMHILSQFGASATNHKNRMAMVNDMRRYFAVSGMPPIAQLAAMIREIIVLVSSAPYPESLGTAILGALSQMFPNSREWASEVLVMDTADLSIVPCGWNEGALSVVITAELSAAKTKEKYPGMYHVLKHLAHMNFELLDTDRKDVAAIESALRFFTYKIKHTRHTIEFELQVMLPAGGGDYLLWFDADGEPTPDLKRVPFEELRQDADQTFHIAISGTFHIVELGCASISLPLVVFEMRCRGSGLHPHKDGDFPLARFDIRMVHMGRQRLTRILLRPFFDIELLRYVLLNHFHTQFEVCPTRAPGLARPPGSDAAAEGEDMADFYIPPSVPRRSSLKKTTIHDTLTIHTQVDDEPATPTGSVEGDKATLGASSEAINLFKKRVSTLPPPPRGTPWQIIMKQRILLLPAPRIITSCFAAFLGQQLGSIDVLKLSSDMLQALALDLELQYKSLFESEKEQDEAHLAKMRMETELDVESAVETTDQRPVGCSVQSMLVGTLNGDSANQ